MFIVTGAGFTANNTVYLQIVSRDGGTRIAFDDASTRSDADGYLLAGFNFGSAVPAGVYVASIATAATGGTILASTNFTLTGPNGPKPGPAVSVTPSQGRGGETFILTGTGFAANTTYTLRVRTENRQTTISFNNSDVQSDADGVILSGFSLAASRPAGTYIAEVVTKGASPTVLANATFALVAGGSPPPAPACASPSTTFCDVPADYWARTQIESFAAKGRTTGCDTDAAGKVYYCPERSVTRAEMAALIVRSLTGRATAPNGPATPTFADVPTTHPQYGFIEELYRRGVTTGCGSNAAGQLIYCPGSDVTRAEMAVFLERAYPATPAR